MTTIGKSAADERGFTQMQIVFSNHIRVIRVNLRLKNMFASAVDEL
jgi:hypothetical protein